MEEIKEKIRQTKLGGKNPMARKVKKINILTGEEIIYDTLVSCAQSFGVIGRGHVISRLNGRIKTPYKGEWMFEYCD